MPATLIKDGDLLKVNLSTCRRGAEFEDALEKIKEMPARKFDWDTKFWILPAEADIAERLVKGVGCTAEQDVLDWIAEAGKEAQQELATPLPDDVEGLMIPWAYARAPWQPEFVNDEEVTGLLDYQRTAVDHLVKVRRAILGDDMGLGKTLVAISAVSEFLVRYARGDYIQSRVSSPVASGEPREGAAVSSGLPQAEPRESTTENEDSSTQLLRDSCCDPQGGEVESLRRLLAQRLAAGSDGAGPCSWDEAFLSMGMGAGEVESGRDTRGSDSDGDREVRRALPYLPQAQALARKPRLVVCPNSVKGAWKRELLRWLGPDTNVVVLEGTAAQRHKQLKDAIASGAWVVCNWESLRVKKVKKDKTIRRADGSTAKRRVTVKEPKEPLFGNTEWLCILADEIHRAKNRQSQQTQGLWLLKGMLMYGLTGTAVQNSPDELWPILAWLWPQEYHENGATHAPGAMAYWSFYSMFVDYYEAYGRKIVTGVRNVDALRFRLRDRFVRRTAAILGLKGRKRIYYPVPLNPEQRKLYDEATEQMWFEVTKAAEEGDKSAQAFVKAAQSGGDIYRVPNGAARMVRQKQIIESPALLGGNDDSAVLDDIVDKILDSRPDQWVVFVEFKGTCDLLKARLESRGLDVGIYNGDVSAEDRTALEDAYQRGEIDVVVGTHAAMREGITLTAGHQQAWATRAVVPAWNDQGEARQDRKGQQNRVNVFIPLAEDTIADGTIQPINRRKERIVARIQPTDTHEEVHQ